MKKLHAILPFFCPFTKTIETAAVWFCCNDCKDNFSIRLKNTHTAGRGTLVERGFAISFNKMGRCAECSNGQN